MIYGPEQKRLAAVYARIRSDLVEISGSIDSSRSGIAEQNRDMWENVGSGSGGFDMNRLVMAKSYLDELARSNKALEHMKRRYGILLQMLKSAYFGRVDFTENISGATNTIYIGIGTLPDKVNGDLLIYDWRAPVCSLFYDSDIGSARYLSPDGIVSGELIKRRQYKIEYDKMIHMIDSDIKIDDEILMELLSGNSGSRMRTIVTTIQKEQNKVIRDEGNDILTAVGPAGSGKTSVAMHRIAYLLYKDKADLDYKDILILTPNDIFSEYISTVLPQLGEENVGETTILDVAKPFVSEFSLQSYKDYMESSLLGNDRERLKNISVKLSLGYLEKLDGYISGIKQKLYSFSDITYCGNTIMSGKELSDIYSDEPDRFTPYQKMQRIRNIIESNIKKYKLAEFENQYKQIIEANDYYSTFEAKRLARINTDRMFTEIDRESANIGGTDWSVQYLEFVRRSFPEVHDMTKRQFDKKYLLYEDVVPYAYFLNEMGAGGRTDNIKHIVIDEFQDHTYITIKFLSKLFKGARFTMLGDQNQTISKYIGNYDPEKDADMFRGRKMLLVKLTKSYRSSYEIYDFCRNILSDDIYGSTAVDRHEKKPETIRLGDDQYADICRFADNAVKDGCKSTAVIAKTGKKAAEVYEGLRKAGADVNLVCDEDSEITGAINVIPSYYAKGLEFDCVIVPDADDRSYHDSGDRKILYTVCTRALHRLAVFYAGKLTRFIDTEDIR